MKVFKGKFSMDKNGMMVISHKMGIFILKIWFWDILATNLYYKKLLFI